MAGKTIQVNLQFNANTSAAKQQMAALQTQLTSLVNMGANMGSLGITPQIQAATQAALQLKVALNGAFSQDTGKLNLGKFQAQLNQMGINLRTLGPQLASLGPQGVQAFSQLTSQIINADTRLFSLQGKIKGVMSTFGSAMKWSLAYGVIGMMTQSLSEGVQYAKELDASLNNIRIVTGKSADSMARFTQEATKAAKDLSISTTKYTDASLIYYQQGLSDSEVLERTNITVKLANIVGESAETVSEWMTAIWNNFDDGIVSLEHYADVLATLGAATASSADEIAGGLEKFAAVADTVGLSYEYAASALATITAETRQSEDVVGTALKTIFARIESLKLGDTLDDGTSLGQYSMALKAVGVDIKNANGELRDMDFILQDIGAAWATLARDEQVALAQSVAGIRQYSQFIALMDNWDVMEQNLQLTEESTGALSEQFRIYEEGLEGAEARMQVAGERAKTALFDGDLLQNWYEFAEGGLGVIADLLEAFGGLDGVIMAAAMALLKMYQPQLIGFVHSLGIGVQTAAVGFANLFGANKLTPQMKMQAEALQMNNEMLKQQYGNETQLVNMLQNRYELDLMTLEIEKQLPESQRELLSLQTQTLKQSEDSIIAETMRLAEVKQENEAYRTQLVLKKQLLQNESADLTNAAQAAGRGDAMLEDALELSKGASKTTGTTTEQRQSVTDMIGSDLDSFKANMLGEGDSNPLGLDAGDRAELTQILEGAQQDLNEYAKGADAALSEVESKIRRLIELYGQMANTSLTSKAKSAIPMDQQHEVGVDALSQVDPNGEAMTYGELEKMTTAKGGGAKRSKMSSQNQQSIREMLKGKEASAKLTKEEMQQVQKIGQSEKARLDTSKKLGNGTRELITTNRKVGAEVENNERGIKRQNQALDSQKGRLATIGQDWAAVTTTLVSGAATAAMSMQMLHSGLQSLFSSEDFGWSDLLSGFTSITFAISMLLPLLTSASAGMTKFIATRALMKKGLDKENAAQLTNILLSKKSQAEKDKEIAKIKTKTGATIAGALADGAAKIISSWGAAIPLVLGALAIAGITVSGISSYSSAQKEKQLESDTKTMNESFDNAEAIKDTAELRKSVKELADEYVRLSLAEVSTKDVLDKIDKDLPTLIEKYEELNRQLGIFIDVERIKQAYDEFQRFGDIGPFRNALAMANQQVYKAQFESYENAIYSAMGVANTSQKDFNNTNDPLEFIKEYETKRQSRNQLVQSGSGDSQTVRDLNSYLDNLQDSYDKIKQSVYGINEALLETAKNDIQKVLDISPETLANYTKLEIKTDKLKEKAKEWAIKQGIDENLINDELLTQIITVDTSVQVVSDADKAVEENGEIWRQVIDEDLETIKKWFNTLKPEDLAIALRLDYTLLGEGFKVDALNKALEAQRQKEAQAEAKVRAQKRKEDLKDYKSYEQTENKLKDIKSALDSISKAKDRAFGTKKGQLIQSENKQLEEQLKSQKQLIQETRAAVIDEQSFINKEGFSTDAAGNIIHKKGTLETLFNAIDVNESIADKDAEKTRIKNALKTYETALSDYKAAVQNELDMQDKLFDNQLEGIQHAFEFGIGLTEDQLAAIDHQLSQIENDAFAAAKSITLLQSKMPQLQKQYDLTKTAIKDIFAPSGVSFDQILNMSAEELSKYEFTAEQIDSLRQYRDGLIDIENQMHSLSEEAFGKVDKAFEDGNEDIEQGLSVLEHYNEVLENYQNIIDLVGKENLGIDDASMAKMYAAGVQNASANIRSIKSQLEANKATLLETEALLSKTSDEATKRRLKETLQTMREQVMEDETALQEALAEGLEAAADEFENRMNQIADSFSEAVAGIAGSIDNLLEQWERFEELDEQYLDDFEKTYELSKLNREAQKKIDSLDSVRNRAKLAQFQEKIKEYQQEGVELSSTQLGYMQKEYDLLVARIALEESQNAKTVVRLQRDSEGNFGYVYTADQNQVDKMQQELEDKEYALKSYSKETQNTLTKNTINIMKQMEEALRDIDTTTEEGKVKYQETLDFYLKQLEYTTTQLDWTMGESAKLNSQYNLDLAQNFKDTWAGSIWTNVNDFKGLYNQTKDAVVEGKNQMVIAIEALEARTNTLFADAGKDVSGFKGEVVTTASTVTTKSNEMASAVEGMAKRMKTALTGPEGAVTALSSFLGTYTGMYATIKAENNKIISDINRVIDKLGDQKLAGTLDNAQDIYNLGSEKSVKGEEEQTENKRIQFKNKKGYNADEDFIIGEDIYHRDPSTNRYYKVGEDDFQNETPNAKKGEERIVSWAADANWYSKKELEILKNQQFAKVPGRTAINTGGFFYLSAASGHPQALTSEEEKQARNSGITDIRTPIQWNGKWFVHTADGQRWYELSHGVESVLNTVSGNIESIFKYRIEEGDQTYLKRFDTGGYTGAWGPEGRLAMLHQKEIVLNAHDTANLLTAVDIVRSMADKLEMNASLASQGLAGLTASITPYHGGDTLEQNVTIHAEFPNATNHNEIEEAFGNLVNLASQYANRK